MSEKTEENRNLSEIYWEVATLLRGAENLLREAARVAVIGGIDPETIRQIGRGMGSMGLLAMSAELTAREWGKRDYDGA